MKILFVSGSFRKQSFNSQLARMAMKAIENQAECRLLSYTDVPFFNQDEEIPVQSPVQTVRDQFEWADGVWFFTPEYNGMIPGVLKNLLDWMSRSIDLSNPAGKSVLSGKPACISGAGGRPAEYNGMIPGVLKNLLDWMSRSIDLSNPAGKSVLSGKPACISGAGGRPAAARSRAQLDQLLKNCRMSVYDQSVGVSLTPDEFKTNEFVDPNIIENTLKEQGEGFLAWIERKDESTKA